MVVCVISIAACSKPDIPKRPELPESPYPLHLEKLYPPASDVTPWWEDAIFYQVFVRSFYDTRQGELADDGIGDLPGLIEKLDYLNDGDPTTDTDLGVNAIWLMPINPSESYHGYDVTNYYDVNPEYGSLDDMRLLVSEAHKRGMRVIIDLVINHTSDEHPWFEHAKDQNSPYHSWYKWAYEQQGWRGFQGQYVWHELKWWDRGWGQLNYLTYYGVFGKHMPDLNLSDPAPTQAIYDIVDFWLSDIRVDGFRLDALRHLVNIDKENQVDTEETHEWLRQFYQHYKSINPEAFTVGEVWAHSNVLRDYYPNQMDLAFEFDLGGDIIRGLDYGERQYIDKALKQTLDIFQDQHFATFLSNHDQNRVMTQLMKDKEKAKGAAHVLFSLPGTPFIYYGEEIGLSGKKPDRQIRTPMQWDGSDYSGFSTSSTWQNVKRYYPKVNVALQQQQPNSFLSIYKRLIRLRQQNPVLTHGDVEFISLGDERLFSIKRSDKHHTLWVISNLDKEPQTLSLDGITPQPVMLDLLSNQSVNTLSLDLAGFQTRWLVAAPQSEVANQ